MYDFVMAEGGSSRSEPGSARWIVGVDGSAGSGVVLQWAVAQGSDRASTRVVRAFGFEPAASVLVVTAGTAAAVNAGDVMTSADEDHVVSFHAVDRVARQPGSCPPLSSGLRPVPGRGWFLLATIHEIAGQAPLVTR